MGMSLETQMILIYGPGRCQSLLVMDFYAERQFVVGGLLFTGLSNADNAASRLENHAITHKPSLTSKF